MVKSDAYQQTFIEFTNYQVFWDEPLNSSVELHISMLEADRIAFIGSAPRLAEDVVCSSRLPSRLARRTRFKASGPAQRLDAFFFAQSHLAFADHPQETRLPCVVAIARAPGTE